MFHTYVASVSSWCSICFTHILHLFHLDVAYVLQWLHTCFPRVSDVLQVFQLFWTYVVNIFSRCYKSRSSVAHVTVDAICSSHWPTTTTGPVCMRVGVERVRTASVGNHTGADWDGSRRGTQSGHETPREVCVRHAPVRTSRHLPFPVSMYV